MWAHITDGMTSKEVGQLEWEMDEAYAEDQRRAGRPVAEPAPVPDTPGENLDAIMRAMSTGVVG